MSPKAASITDHTGVQGSELDANTRKRMARGRRKRVCEGQEEGDGACATRIYVIVSSATGDGGDGQESVSV